MNIFSTNGLYAFSSYAISLFKDQVSPSLTAQQKKILWIVSMAFACLAIYCAIKQCCFKAQLLNGSEKKGDPNDNILEENDDKLPEELFDAKERIFDFEVKCSNDTLNGYGRINCSDLDRVYEGEFKDGELHGNGKIIYDDMTLEGRFENGDFKEGKVLLTDGTVHQGVFKGFYLHGQGKIILPNETVEEEGVFESGILHGQGKRVYPNGIVEEGLFNYGHCIEPESQDKNTVIHGPGKKLDCNGCVLEKGIFEKWQAQWPRNDYLI